MNKKIKRYTEQEYEYLEKNYYKYSSSYLAKKLGRTERSIKSFANRNEIKKETYSRNDFIRFNDLMNEAEKLDIRPRTIRKFYRSGYIKIISKTNTHKFITEHTYEKWLNFFENYLPIDVFKRKSGLTMARIRGYINNKNIEFMEFPKFKNHKYWIARTELETALELKNEYIYKVSDFAKLVFYHEHHIRRLINQNKVKYKKIYGVKYIHKSELWRFKEGLHNE